MTTVSPDRDRVVLTLSPRGSDLIMTPDQARWLAEAMRAAAAECETWEAAGGRPALTRGEVRGAQVKSWDGRVNLRLDSAADREELPYRAARQIADLLESRATEAEGRLTLVWTPNRSQQ